MTSKKCCQGSKYYSVVFKKTDRVYLHFILLIPILTSSLTEYEVDESYLVNLSFSQIYHKKVISTESNRQHYFYSIHWLY
ncbi:MAG: hypothetical protein RL679_382 [Bacteroidota bacterium]